MMTKWLRLGTCLLLLFAAISVRHARGDQQGDQKQPAIKALQEKRRDLLIKAADMMAARWKSNDVDFSRVAAAERAAILATLQLADTPEARIAALGDLLKSAEELVKVAKTRERGSKLGVIDLVQAEALVLEVQIEKATAEKLAEKQVEINKLQRQRVVNLKKSLDVLTKQYKAGKTDVLKVAEIHRSLVLATVDLADTSDKRIAALSEFEKLAEEIVKLTKARAEIGAANSEVDYPLAQALALEARIVRLKEEAKAAAGKK